MTDQKEKTSALVADDCSTQPNSPDLGKLDSVFGPSGTTSATENAIAATTTTDTTTTTQPNEVDIEALRQTSRHGSVLNQPVKVPRSNRRGLFGRLTILAEVEDPKSYPRGTKWFITFVVAIAGMAAPLGSTIIFPAISEITNDFETSPTVTNLAVALFLGSMAIFPLWWSSFSEKFGRRSIYLISFSLFVLWTVLAAVSTNISMLVVMRLLEGGAASSVQVVGAGTVADIWAVRERGEAMGVFYLGPLLGPFLGPIIGGLLAGKLGWRSTQWFLAIYGAILLVFILFALPETLKGTKPSWVETQIPIDCTSSDRPELARVRSRRSLQQSTRKWIVFLKRGLVDPLKILLYLRFPAVLITVYYVSVAFGSLYLINVSIEWTFSKPPYDFSAIMIGLAYIPSSVGYFLASVFGGRWTDAIMAREARKAGRYDADGKLVYQPEDRMRENAWTAAFLYPAALIWYGWTAETHVHSVVPLIANFFFGVGSMLIFGMATTMLTEFMPRKASAGVAANNFIRNLVSSLCAFAAEPMLRAIGNGWLFTGVGIIAMASSSVVWAMRKFGPRWRVAMSHALDKEG